MKRVLAPSCTASGCANPTWDDSGRCHHHRGAGGVSVSVPRALSVPLATPSDKERWLAAFDDPGYLEDADWSVEYECHTEPLSSFGVEVLPADELVKVEPFVRDALLTYPRPTSCGPVSCIDPSEVRYALQDSVRPDVLKHYLTTEFYEGGSWDPDQDLEGGRYGNIEALMLRLEDGSLAVLDGTHRLVVAMLEGEQLRCQILEPALGREQPALEYDTTVNGRQAPWDSPHWDRPRPPWADN